MSKKIHLKFVNTEKDHIKPSVIENKWPLLLIVLKA